MSGTFVQAFGGFCVRRDGDPIRLPLDVERLVAFLCVHGGQMPRPYVAGVLWPDGTDKRALGNLRSVLWRLRKGHPDLVAADSHSLWLGAEVSCDITDVVERSNRLSEDKVIDLRPHLNTGRVTTQLTDTDGLCHRPFAHEFLPGWYDEWVLVERERMRQLCLHALEEIARRHAEQQRFGAAIQALLASISLDDLRESPRRQLISIHLAEGNPTEALRHYNEYAATLDSALGLAPSAAMHDLVSRALDGPARPQNESVATAPRRSRNAVSTGRSA